MLIDFQDVNIGYGEHILLKNVNFQIREREFVFITGIVGSGKTTFLKSIYAETQIISAKRALVLGFDLTRIKTRQIPLLRRQIGFVFQDFRLLTDRNVYENLRFVLRSTGWTIELKIKRRINQVLKFVQMQDYASAMPYELSGGQQQKIAIARAILNNPKLILADEPTGNLDIHASKQIIQLLNQLRCDGTAIIIATHNTNLLNLISDSQKYIIDQKKLLQSV